MANARAHRLATWLATPAGQRVLAEETAPLAEAVRRAHGDTLLWLGCHEVMAQAVRGCMVRSRLFGAVLPGPAMTDTPVLRCLPEALPVANNTLDAIVLHHALETSADPRGVLREAARAIAPGGRLIVCAFNPLSLWGVRRCVAQFRPDAFRGLHLITTLRLLDWLAVLGFEVQAQPLHLQYGLPFQRERARTDDNALQRALRRRRVPLGGVYLVSATKQAAAMRPLKRVATGIARPGFAARPAFGNSNVVPLQLPAARLREPPQSPDYP